MDDAPKGVWASVRVGRVGRSVVVRRRTVARREACVRVGVRACVRVRGWWCRLSWFD